MWELLGLIKALLTDLSGGFHPRKFKDPTELQLWETAQDIRDYKDLLKMSQDEMSEEQQQALLSDDEQAREATVLHSFSTSKAELAKPRQDQEEELVQKGYEEVIEDPDADESSKVEATDGSEFPEMPPTLGPSLDWEEGSEAEESEAAEGSDGGELPEW